ncbi:MAG: discoidin domain-containing protein [Clostridiales bacterium]|nr:MAG: discoidin domain-containing protein [Clostridiales bacterium]
MCLTRLFFTVYADDNISSGKSVYASSRYSANHDPSNVLDGNEKTFWSTGSDTSAENLTGRVNSLHYIMIDLGEKHFISKIVLKSRRDIDRPNERKGYTIEGADDFNFSRSAILGTKRFGRRFFKKAIWSLTNSEQSYQIHTRNLKKHNEYERI